LGLNGKVTVSCGDVAVVSAAFLRNCFLHLQGKKEATGTEGRRKANAAVRESVRDRGKYLRWKGR
jgi:hypothetical protein